MAPVATALPKRQRLAPTHDHLADRPSRPTADGDGHDGQASQHHSSLRTSSKRPPLASRIFQPFRALGFVTNHVPSRLVVRHGGKDATRPDVNLVTCLGTSWALWDADRITLLFVGAVPTPTSAGATAASPIHDLEVCQGSGGRDGILACAGDSVYRFERGRVVDVFVARPSDVESYAEGGAPGAHADDDDHPVARPGTGTPLSLLCHFGELLLALSADGRRLFLWSLLTRSLIHAIPLDAARPAAVAPPRRSPTPPTAPFTASAILHPATYVDKVLLGSHQGGLQLWNVRAAQRIHTFSARRLRRAAGDPAAISNSKAARDEADRRGESEDDRGDDDDDEDDEDDDDVDFVAPPVVALEQTPAIDVVAIAWEDGYVLLHDVRYDEALVCANVSRNGGGLSRGCLSFRTDGRAHTMAVGTRSGNICIFDLQASVASDAATAAAASSSVGLAAPARLLSTLRGAHASAVGSVNFVPGQALLVSSGADNAVRQWYFESSAASASTFADGGAAADVRGDAEAGAGVAPTGGSASTARLLKSREGAAAPPRIVRHYGDDGRALLTAGGEDRSVRVLSVVRESRSSELSQGNLASKSQKLSVPLLSLKLPAASSIAFSTTRSRDWEDVLTTHASRAAAQRWSVRQRRMADSPLLPGGSKQPRGPGGGGGASDAAALATCACVSACGNFGLVGDEAGKVEVYNMQSGLWRRRFDTRPVAPSSNPTGAAAVAAAAAAAKAKPKLRRGRGSAVRGVVTDAVNRTAVVGLQDGRLCFFDFHTAELLQTLKNPSGLSQLLLHRATALLASVHDDLCVRVHDVETRRLVRVFTGFRGRILDVGFSSDGRWLLASSLDGWIRTFDVPSARLVDALRVRPAATSVSLSPTADFLATTHVGELGVYLWANRTQFASVALGGVDEARLEEVERLEAEAEAEAEVEAGGSPNGLAFAATATLPTVQGEAVPDQEEEEDMARITEYGYGENDAYESDEDEAEDGDGRAAARRLAWRAPEQLTLDGDAASRGLVTFSSMPRSRWLTLLHLDTIRQRDRPREPPKKPERAPFFLPQLLGVETRFDVAGGGAAGTEAHHAQARDGKGGGTKERPAAVVFETELARRMALAEEASQYNGLFAYLDTLTAPALELEVRSLNRSRDQCRLLRVLAARLREGRDFEAVQTLLALAVRIHGDVLIGVGSLARRRRLSLRGDSGGGGGEEGEGGWGGLDEGEMGVALGLDQSGGDQSGMVGRGRGHHQQADEVREAVETVLASLEEQGSRLAHLVEYCVGCLAFVRNVPLT